MLRKLFRKLFASAYYFTIAIKHKSKNILEVLHFNAEYTIPANVKEWCADPILADDGDKTYLFYEQVEDDLGRIEVVEVNEDCSISKPTVIFRGTHYSYPYVFKSEDKWYMIPESSALNEVCLYSAEKFPYEWKKEKVLLNKGAVDTTVFQKNGEWYLLTFVPSKTSENVNPEAYRLCGDKLMPLKWIDYDTLKVRGAGKPFEYIGEIFRPVQESTATRYGDSVAFVKIEISDNEYRETVISKLEATSIKADKRHYDGLHTYCASDKFEAIDIRCRDYSFKWLIRKIINRINK